MPVGTLFLVATPIGNLEDITLRALRVLRDVNLIAAEDTRHTAKLLAHYGIPTRMTSFHAHNARRRTPQLVSLLQAGRSVALVTDAGTPGISDPGAELVRACVAGGIFVDPVPGPCAPIAAAVASGFRLEELSILGFPPIRSKDRSLFFDGVLRTPGTIVFLEAPHRIMRTIIDLARLLGDRQIMLAREMTKLHQQFIFGSASDLADRTVPPVGEYTIVIGPSEKNHKMNKLPVSEAEVRRDFYQMTEHGRLDRRETVRAVAKKHGLQVNQVYRLVQGRNDSAK